MDGSPHKNWHRHRKKNADLRGKVRKIECLINVAISCSYESEQLQTRNGIDLNVRSSKEHTIGRPLHSEACLCGDIGGRPPSSYTYLKELQQVTIDIYRIDMGRTGCVNHRPR